MKNISIWAKNNRAKALGLTILLHVIISYYFFYVGALLLTKKIILPFSIVYISGVLLLTSYIFYPIKYVRRGIFKRTFFREKQWQLVAMISAALLMVFIGNHSAKSAFLEINRVPEYSAITVAVDVKQEPRVGKKSKVEKRTQRQFIKKTKRQLRKRIRKNVRKLRAKEKGLTSFEKSLIAFLSLLLGIVLGYLVLALSCSIACSGNEALALIVLLGGFTLIIVGFVAILRSLFGKQARKEMEQDKIKTQQGKSG